MTKLDFTKIKNISFPKSHYYRNKKISHRLVEISVNHMSNKGVISKIFKEISKLHNKKASNPIKNEQILRIFFTKKDIQVENKQ